MKILHLCLGNFFIDHYSYQENMLTKYHALEGHEVTVIAMSFTYDENGKGIEMPTPARYKNEHGCNIIRLAYRRPIRWNRFFRHYQGLFQAIAEISPDIIFSHNVSYGDTVVVKKYLKRHPKVKLYADNHADYINSAKNWWSSHILHPIIWRHYAKVIEPFIVKCYGVTPMRCRFLKEMYHLNPNIIEYLPLGVDDDLIPANREERRLDVRQKLGISNDDFLIVTGGKIDMLKNTHVLVDALEHLKSPKVHLVICGVLTPQMEFLKEKMEANKNIHYLGWGDAGRVMDCMVAADLACFPGTHSTLWEQSVGVGIPAVFKRWPEMEHVNVNGNCVFVQGEDVEELTCVLQELSRRDEKYYTLKKQSEIASRSLLYSEIAKKAIDYK